MTQSFLPSAFSVLPDECGGNIKNVEKTAVQMWSSKWPFRSVPLSPAVGG